MIFIELLSLLPPFSLKPQQEMIAKEPGKHNDMAEEIYCLHKLVGGGEGERGRGCERKRDLMG